MTILRKRNIDDDWFYESLTFALLAFRIPWKTAQRTGCYFPFFHNCGDPAFLRPTSEPPRTKTMLVSERSFVTPFLWALALCHVSKNHHPFANNVFLVSNFYILFYNNYKFLKDTFPKFLWFHGGYFNKIGALDETWTHTGFPIGFWDQRVYHSATSATKRILVFIREKVEYRLHYLFIIFK